MNSTLFVTMALALGLGLGLVLLVAMASLMTGALYFLLGKSQWKILKSQKRPNGLAFAYCWNSARQPAKFEVFTLKLFNPFGRPSRMDLSQEIPPKNETFACDLDLGPGLQKILHADGLKRATVELELSAPKEGLVVSLSMKAQKFLDQVKRATQTLGEFEQVHPPGPSDSPVYHTPKRDFIAPPMEGGGQRVLKMATNPLFAGAIPSDATAAEAPQEENFEVSKVWIDPGCIVCDACEAIYPEVFHVTDDTCIIRPDAPLHNGLLIEEAADACPVEVIKFTKK